MTLIQPRRRRVYQELMREWRFISRWRIAVRVPLILMGVWIVHYYSGGLEPLVGQIDRADERQRKMEQLHYKKIEVAQELIAERDSLATNLQQMLVVMTNIETWISTNPSVAAHLEQPKLKLAVGVAETSNLVSNYTQKIEKLEGQYADDENQQNRFQEETTRLATKLG